MIQQYLAYLSVCNLSVNTVISYQHAIRQFADMYGNKVTAAKLADYRAYLLSNHSPSTVNVRIAAVNNMLSHCNRHSLKLKLVRMPHQTFADNVINWQQYQYLTSCLLQEKSLKWYFAVKLLATTGARIGELVQIRIEDINKGYVDVLGKGDKLRRLYICDSLQREVSLWSNSEAASSVCLFVNKFGKRITTRGLAQQLKKLAIKYGMDATVVYPHSFRHYYAKNFLANHNDIAMLADLLGHDSIQTTRGYLRKSSCEQRQLINRIVNW